MTNEQFKVTFSANNQLSAVLTQITNELDQTYQTAGKTTKAMQSLSKSFTSTAGMNKFSQNMLAVQNSLNTLSGTLNVSKLNNAATAVTNIANALQALSKITGPKSVISSLRSLSNLSVNKLSSSMQKLAVSSGAVARNLNSIAKSMTKLNAMGALNAKMKITTPTTGTTGTSTTGTGTTGGTAAATAKATKPMTAWKTFEKTLHVFNSLSFAVGTVTLAMQRFYDNIAKGNELTDRQATLLAVVQSKGLNPSITATQKYGQAMQVAVENQRLFGGSLAESIDGMFKLQQMSQASGVSIHELNKAVQLLSMRDPVQGIEGATIAIQELLSGDPLSLRRRFELPASEINKLANMSGNATLQLEGLTKVLEQQGITADVLNERLNTTAQTYRNFESAIDNFWTVFGQGQAQRFEGVFKGLGDTAVNLMFSPYYYQALQDGSDDIREYMDEHTKAIYEGYVLSGQIIDEAVRKSVEVQRNAYEESIRLDEQRLNSLRRYAEESARLRAGEVAQIGNNVDNVTDLTQSIEDQAKATKLSTHLQYAMAYIMKDGAFSAFRFDEAIEKLRDTFAFTDEEAAGLTTALDSLLKAQMDANGVTDKNYEAYWGLSLAQKEATKSTAALADETYRLYEIYLDTQRRLVEFDKEVYRKRIREMQAYYADATLLQQKRAYEMRANDLDLVEGKNKKLDAADRQRLLARENIEAYGQLQMNQAVAQANEYALQGNAKFAKEYLAIQEERISDGEKLYQQLHDTQVRLEGDPEAQQRAKQVYDDAIKLQEEYYTTRVGLADAAARQEREEEASQRRQIIDDAIQSVMQLENVDESRRQAIIQGLEIAKTTITDLSNTYVDKVDAMRGSLDLLANALARVRNESNILTPDQLAAFNGLGIGQITAPPGGSIDVNQTTVNVGGINISVASQVDPAQIRTIVLDVLQKQLNQRG